jgi:hypothetical protein
VACVVTFRRRRSEDGLARHPGARLAGELPPQPLKPVASDARVVRGVLWIAVPEVILHGAQIGAPVGQVVAAAVAKHVRPHPPQLGRLAGDPHDVVHGLAGELRLPLGDEQPGELVLAGGEVPLEGAQLVASDRLLDR